jgi:hypothetical protein
MYRDKEKVVGVFCAFSLRRFTGLARLEMQRLLPFVGNITLQGNFDPSKIIAQFR